MYVNCISHIDANTGQHNRLLRPGPLRQQPHRGDVHDHLCTSALAGEVSIEEKGHQNWVVVSSERGNLKARKPKLQTCARKLELYR